MKGTPKYNQRTQYKKEYKAGKWYDNEELDCDLTGNLIRNMFRKPIAGERTPDSITHKTDDDGEYSDYYMCVNSFTIKIICDFNNPI